MKLSPTKVYRTSLWLLAIALLFSTVWNLPIAFAPLLPAYPVVTGEKPLRFVIVAPLSDSHTWTKVAQGARSASEALQLNVEFTSPRHAAVAEQIRLIDSAAAAQVDGIITLGVPDAEVAAAVARAADRGIPVVTAEVDLPDPGRRLAYVGTDNYEAGRLAAYELLLRTGGKAVVGIVRGHFGPAEEDLRIKGFQDVLATAPDVRIVAIESSNSNRTLAGQKALAIIEQFPDVNVFYATTVQDTIGVAQSITAKGIRNRILLIGWDVNGEADEVLVRGGLHAVILQDPEAMGRRAVQVLEAYLRRDLRPDSTTYIPVMIRSGGAAR
ncbi:MAG: sugar ABC transporter substrate-binding protein [Bacillota bacterium]